MAPTSSRPARSVTVPGIIMPRPPTTSRIRRGQPTFLNRWPLRAAAMPKIPSRALTQICTTSHQPEMFSNSSAGLYAKMYGTMKAAMASFVALRPVFMGLDLAMAEPA